MLQMRYYTNVKTGGKGGSKSFAKHVQARHSDLPNSVRTEHVAHVVPVPIPGPPPKVITPLGSD